MNLNPYADLRRKTFRAFVFWPDDILPQFQVVLTDRKDLSRIDSDQMDESVFQSNNWVSLWIS
jgi:hypothetical protein